jgi:Ssp1 endopeptidase immunity protein Rap1a
MSITRFRLATALVATFMAAAAVHAQSPSRGAAVNAHSPYEGNDGNELLLECVAAEKLFDNPSFRLTPAGDRHATSCVVYVDAILDLNGIYEVRGHAVFCRPAGGLTNETAVRLLLKFLRDHPKRLSEEMIVLTVDAFKTVFPCPR